MRHNIFKFYGIRKKLIIYFLVTILLLSASSIYSYYNGRTILKNSNDIIEDYIFLNDLKSDVNFMMTELEQYLTTASSENLLNYYYYYNKLKEESRQISTTKEYDYDKLLLKDLRYMLDELMLESDKAIKAKRGRISSKYISHFQRTEEISNYIKLYDNMLLDSKLKAGSEKYENINRSMNIISYVNVIIIIATIFVNLCIALISTYKLMKPITQLSHSAEKIAEGDFDIELTQTKTGDETDILASAFIKMVKSIKEYINELKEHVEIEKKLKEQEVHNLKMQSLLKEAELKFLQSQINPHFLFNTLNAASQLAMIEGADKSSEFMENIAQLFRYNLKNMEELVSLREEVEYVNNYMNILKKRFGSRISFLSHIDEEALDVRIPRITIQPIVENAYIHGLQDLEKNGTIELNIRSFEDYITIEIADDGKGMDESTIEAIISSERDKKAVKSHITGIGLNNVLERLQILFNISSRRNLISIDSEVGQGTRLTLKIPKVEQEGGGI
ncbi:MAG: histidine kinase [Clostridia bacterium]|jgi:sensor histidine kinase YesM|nr:histidine kinase [Clostridia bacterium]